MADFSLLSVTNLGKAAQAEANALGEPLVYTSIQVGSGSLGGGQTPQTITALVAPVGNAEFDGANTTVTYQATLRMTVSSALSSSLYQLNEIGIFASVGSGSPILFAYANAAGTGDEIPPAGGGAPVLYEYLLAITFNQATTTSATLSVVPTFQLHGNTHLNPDPTTGVAGIDALPLPTTTTDGLMPKLKGVAGWFIDGLAGSWVQIAWSVIQGIPTYFNPQDHAARHYNPSTSGQSGPGSDNIPVATSALPGLVPVSTATGKKFLCDNNPASWVFGIQVLEANTTLYVSTTGNDSTAEPNSTSFPWATIAGALDWLGSYLIFPGVTVTISVETGVYTSTSPILVAHPQSSQIEIVGHAPTYSVSPTGISLSGSPGNFTITFTVASAAGVGVGDIVTFEASGGGNNLHRYDGVFVVTAKTSTSISVASQYATNPSSGSSITGTLTKIPVVLSFTGCSGIQIQNGCNLGLLSNLVIEGDGSSGNNYNGIEAFTNASLLTGPNCAVVNFSNFGAVIQQPGSSLNIPGIVISGCSGGGIIGVLGGGINCQDAIVSGCGGATHAWALGTFSTGWNIGIFSDVASVNCQGAVVVGNDGNGICSSPGILNAEGVIGSGGVRTFSWDNGQFGFYAQNGASISADYSDAQGNAQFDYGVTGHAYITAVGFRAGSSTFSPAANTLSPDGSYINT
jgi:hypothetical protein